MWMNLSLRLALPELGLWLQINDLDSLCPACNPRQQTNCRLWISPFPVLVELQSFAFCVGISSFPDHALPLHYRPGSPSFRQLPISPSNSLPTYINFCRSVFSQIRLHSGIQYSIEWLWFMLPFPTPLTIWLTCVRVVTLVSNQVNIEGERLSSTRSLTGPSDSPKLNSFAVAYGLLSVCIHSAESSPFAHQWSHMSVRVRNYAATALSPSSISLIRPTH